MSKDFYSKKMPEVLQLRLTQYCNLHCIYCYMDAKSRGIVMHVKIIEKALEEAKKYEIPLIQLDGGEPLLYPKFLSLLDLIAKNDFAVGLSTNGTLLNEGVANKLSGINVSQILTNIDGRKAIHDKLRGRSGSYDSIIKTLNTLENYNLIRNTVIATVLTKLNYREVPYIVETVKSYPIMEYRFITFMSIGRGTVNERGCMMNKDDWRMFIYHVLPEIFKEKINVKFSFAHMLFFQILKNVGLNVDAMNTVINKMQQLKEPIGCEGGDQVMVINTNGEASPCPHLPHLHTSESLKDNSLQQLWNSQVFRDFRENKRKIPKDCESCPFVNYCKGGCQAIKFSYASRLVEKDPRCRIFEKIRKEINNG